jgi:hypothetical protein
MRCPDDLGPCTGRQGSRCLAFQIAEGAGGDRSGVITGKTGREVISDVADTIVGELVSLNVQSNGLEGWKAHP